jgi:UDP-N-acetylmuramoyl-tripeptide--D-alanyl-D-alanine ligase
MVSDVALDGRGRASFRLTHHGDTRAMILQQAGLRQPLNAAAAVSAALALGRDFAEAADRVAGAGVSPWRMEVREVPVGGGTVVVVNDAYNANPDSMAAAFETVSAMPGRHIAVLGKMHELGASEGNLHRTVGALAAASGFAVVLVVGDDPGLAAGAGAVAEVQPDADAAASRLASILSPGDVILVKASRAAGLERIAEGIGGGAAA